LVGAKCQHDAGGRHEQGLQEDVPDRLPAVRRQDFNRLLHTDPAASVGHPAAGDNHFFTAQRHLIYKIIISNLSHSNFDYYELL
jgi:hypothetical protein